MSAWYSWSYRPGDRVEVRHSTGLETPPVVWVEVQERAPAFSWLGAVPARVGRSAA